MKKMLIIGTGLSPSNTAALLKLLQESHTEVYLGDDDIDGTDVDYSLNEDGGINVTVIEPKKRRRSIVGILGCSEFDADELLGLDSELDQRLLTSLTSLRGLVHPTTSAFVDEPCEDFPWNHRKPIVSSGRNRKTKSAISQRNRSNRRKAKRKK